jgi:hypothetical protein
MVLCQFLISNQNGGPTTNGNWIDVNVNGPCNARLVQYVLIHNNIHIIQVQSDVFKTPYSGGDLSRGVLIANGGVYGFDQSHRDYHWNNVVIPGRVQFTIIDTETKEPLAGTWRLVLTFDLESLP